MRNTLNVSHATWRSKLSRNIGRGFWYIVWSLRYVCCLFTFPIFFRDPRDWRKYLNSDERDHSKGYCKGLVCDICGADYNNHSVKARKRSFIEHQKSCKYNEEYVCDICGQSFKTKQGITNHEKKTHTIEARVRRSFIHHSDIDITLSPDVVEHRL